jgi:sialate O-acetylesterase
MYKKISKRFIVAVMSVVTAAMAMADVKPAGLFVDNMVIQRETQAPVWGWAGAGEKVTVTGSWGESATTTADQNGKWSVKLQTPAAGGPYTITFKGKNRVELKNVLSGDVWLCSGQSNMQWPVSKAANSDEEAAQANHPQIRHFMVARTPALDRADDCGGEWTVCSPKTVKEFSAVAYFTGRELQKSLDVPVGLITSAWGGTCVEAWTPWSVQADDRFAQARKAPLYEKAKGYSPEKAQADFELKLEKWEQKAAVARAKKKRVPRKPSLKGDPRVDQNYPGRKECKGDGRCRALPSGLGPYGSQLARGMGPGFSVLFCSVAQL